MNKNIILRRQQESKRNVCLRHKIVPVGLLYVLANTDRINKANHTREKREKCSIKTNKRDIQKSKPALTFDDLEQTLLPLLSLEVDDVLGV